MLGVIGLFMSYLRRGASLGTSLVTRVFVLILTFGQVCASQALKEFTVGTYNLENYLDAPAGNRPVKSAGARAKIRENIRAMKADVLGLQEVGGSNALEGLRLALKAEGLD